MFSTFPHKKVQFLGINKEHLGFRTCSAHSSMFCTFLCLSCTFLYVCTFLCVFCSFLYVLHIPLCVLHIPLRVLHIPLCGLHIPLCSVHSFMFYTFLYALYIIPLCSVNFHCFKHTTTTCNSAVCPFSL